MDELTNDAKYYLAVAYEQYLKNVKAGLSKPKARYLGDIPDMQTALFPEWHKQDIADLSNELRLAGFVELDQYWGPFPSNIKLTTKAVSYGEQKFAREINSVVDGILKLKKLIF